MTLNEYQQEAIKTAVPNARSITYMTLGLVNEAGEVAGKRKKFLRGDYDGKEVLLLEQTLSEIGDCLWYIAGLAGEYGFTLNDVAEHNLKKLADRQQRGKIQGDGDKR